MQANLASLPHLLKKKCWGLSSNHGKITARASPPHSMYHSTAHHGMPWDACIGFGPQVSPKKRWVWRQVDCRPWCLVLHLPQTAFPSVSGWIIAWWKDKGIQHMCRICITHVLTYSPSWLLCSTNVSLQLWAPRNPCCEQQPDMILPMSGRRKTSWLAIGHKAGVPDS